MRPVAILAAGSTFVGCVLAGFAVGIGLARRTGASSWAIVGVFAGLLLGVGSVTVLLGRSLR
jgi:hypothetical protein